MKLIIDMNLSPRWVGVGLEAAHWSTLGAKNAPDSEIMAYASAGPGVRERSWLSSSGVSGIAMTVSINASRARRKLMRTTLDIEDDVLLAAKELARRDGTTAGGVISTLLRQALTQAPSATTSSTGEPAAIHGFRPFPSRGKVVTNEQVNPIRDEEGV